MKLSATMCISRTDHLPSLQSLQRHNDIDELCLSPNAGFEYVCADHDADVCVECTPSKPWEPYGRHRLYDEATGDWYLTLDDDDLAVEPLRPHLETVNDDVGLVFGDVVMRWKGRNGISNHEELRRNDHDFSELYNCVYWSGGYYALRADAWKDVRELMDTRFMIHGDTRLFYWLQKAGWTWYRVPKWTEIVQLKRRTTDWERYSPGWDAVFQALERGESPEDWLLMDA